MAKQTRQAQYNQLSQEAEYALVKKDLRRVLILNAFYLILLLALYFTNLNGHYLDKWFSRILHF